MLPLFGAPRGKWTRKTMFISSLIDVIPKRRAAGVNPDRKNTIREKWAMRHAGSGVDWDKTGHQKILSEAVRACCWTATAVGGIVWREVFVPCWTTQCDKEGMNETRIPWRGFSGVRSASMNLKIDYTSSDSSAFVTRRRQSLHFDHRKNG